MHYLIDKMFDNFKIAKYNNLFFKIINYLFKYFLY